jgi:SNF2 family DNA or RNA helicase
VTQKIQKIKSKKNKRTQGMRPISQVAQEDSEEEDVDPDWIDMGEVVLPSAKLAATKATILNWRQTHPNEKIIIYTQFLGLCRILERVCTAEGWGHVLFNGKMTLEARQKSLQKFHEDREIFILICSLKAGGVGLNLSMASKVIILDLWFNSSIEAQAYCRAFRIGQPNVVEVVRFVVKDSIDEDLIKMQDRKDIEVTGAIGPESHGKRATIAQLLALFGEVTQEGQNEFILVEDENDEDEWDARVADRVPPRPF